MTQTEPDAIPVTFARFGPDRWEDYLICPAPGCGCENVHIESTNYFARPAGEDALTIHYGASHRGSASHVCEENPSSRRDAATIVFSCEWGHTFELRFIQHKGTTFTDVTNVKQRPDWPFTEEDR